jgi:hypothetical protein
MEGGAMLKLVNTIAELVTNVCEYQKAVQQSSRVTPSRVIAWYYIPALDMVGASRFIGYKGMTAAIYDQSEEVHGGVTEAHLQKKGWFRPLQKGEAYYTRAYHLAAPLDKQGRVNSHARFNVLKDAYDEQVKNLKINVEE